MFLEDLLNIPCSPARTVKNQNLVNDSIAQPYEQLREELENQRQLFVDESPTKQQRLKAWWWVAVAPMFAVFCLGADKTARSAHLEPTLIRIGSQNLRYRPCILISH